MGHLPNGLSYRNISTRSAILCLWVASVVWLACSVSAAADTGKALPTDGRNEKVRITADRLVVDSKAMVADFIGNVRASQGEIVIEADQLRVHYQSNGEPQKEGEESIESIEKIVATGNVRIQFENRLAETPEAVYYMHTRKFVLTGPGTRVTSGKHFISGEKIVLRRDDGRVTVEKGGQERVEAVFYPEGDALKKK